MFEPLPSEKKSRVAGAFTIFAFGMLLGLGLCGLGNVGASLPTWQMSLLILGGVVFSVCQIGLLVTAAIWVAKKLLEAFRK